MNITEFLLARITEDEAMARAASGEQWHGQACEVRTVPESGKPWSWSKVAEMYHSNHFADALHIARHDPARVLAEYEAKRAIVESFKASIESQGSLGVKGMSIAYEIAVKCLAEVYKDHPDYQQEWLVST